MSKLQDRIPQETQRQNAPDQDAPDQDAPALRDIGLENFPPYLMNRIMGRYNASLRAEMAALGITTAQMRALAMLSVVDGLLIWRLAVYTVTEQSTLSRALDSLARAGFVRRETDSADGRGTRVFLTRAGRDAHTRLWPHMARSSADMLEGVDDDARRAFIATLQRILRNIRKHDF